MAVDYTALLEKALATGASSVSVDGQQISFRSASELKQLIDLLKQEELAASGELGIGIRRTEYRR